MDKTTEPDGMFTEGSVFYICFKTFCQVIVVRTILSTFAHPVNDIRGDLRDIQPR